MLVHVLHQIAINITVNNTKHLFPIAISEAHLKFIQPFYTAKQGILSYVKLVVALELKVK